MRRSADALLPRIFLAIVSSVAGLSLVALVGGGVTHYEAPEEIWIAFPYPAPAGFAGPPIVAESRTPGGPEIGLPIQPPVDPAPPPRLSAWTRSVTSTCASGQRYDRNVAYVDTGERTTVAAVEWARYRRADDR